MITINIDLGAAVEIEAMVLFDHNLSSAATITLIGADPPLFTEPIAWAADKILHFLSVATTKRYWQLQITDAANPDGYIEIGEFYLGPYLELTENYMEGYSEETAFLMESNRTRFGVGNDRFYNSQLAFNFNFGMMPPADVASMKTLIAAIASRSLGTLKPFWFNKDSATPEESWLVKIASLPVNHRTRAYFDMPIVLTEVLKSV